MKITLGIAGYILLIVSAAFLDVPFLGLLAIPIFIVSVGMVLTFYLSLISKETSKRWLAISLISTGTILLSAVVGHSAIKFTVYLVANSRGEVDEFFPSLWLNVFQIIGVNILASLIILIGIKQRSIMNKRLYLAWLPTFLVIPLVTLLIKLMELIGIPLSA